MLIIKKHSTRELQNCLSIINQMISHGHVDARQIRQIITATVEQRFDQLQKNVALEMAGACPSCGSTQTLIYPVEDVDGDILRIFECRRPGCWYSRIED